MGKLNDDWYHGFRSCFETDEDVIEFISDRLKTSDFEDSYIDAVGFGEPDECFKITADEKRVQLIIFLEELIEEKDKLKEIIDNLVEIINSQNLVYRFRGENESEDYHNGYNVGYTKAIKNVISRIKRR